MLDVEKLYGCTSEADLLVHALQRFPNRVALSMPLSTSETTITYQDLADGISKYSQALTDLGFVQGDRVGLLSGNRIEVIYVNFALGMLGCCLVPLHPMGSLQDHEYVVQDAELAGLIFDVDNYAERASALQHKGVATLAGLGDMPTVPNLISHAEIFLVETLIPPVLPQDKVCRLSYSGGTTGKPKAIIGTPLSLLTKTMIQLIEWQWPENIKQLLCAPLSHAGGAMVLPTLIRGGSIVVLSGFDVPAVMKVIESHQINCMLMVPTMICNLLDHPDIDDYDLSSLETIFYGAAPMPPSRLREAIQKFGQIFFQFYGQTESPLTPIVMRKEEHLVENSNRMASCGRPVPWVRVAIFDDAGEPVVDGDVGEICIRGPLVMGGYWNKDEQTKEAFEGDWLHTGDMAVRDPDGFLRIVDRKKDMIISGGFNVFAREVEDAICEHSAVASCAVFGVPDDRWGEAVASIVVVKSGEDVSVEELIAMVKRLKGSIQAPKIIHFVDEIPLTSLGKPDKKRLRAQYAVSS